MIQKTGFFIFKIVCLVYMLLSSYMWIGVLMSRTVLVGAANFAMILCLILMGVRVKVNYRLINLCLILALIFLYFACFWGLVYGVYMACSYLPALFLFILPEQHKEKILYFVTKWFGIMVLLGIVVYFGLMVFPFKSPLPPVYDEKISNYPVFYNYIFYLKPNVSYGTLVRFQGFFLEPGHLALNCIMILAANNFDFKKNKYIWCLLGGVLVSLSLAGYLLLIVGWILMKVKDMKTVISSSFVALVAIIGIQTWGGGDNRVNDVVFSRLKVDKHKGIEGNNRTTARTDAMYDIAVSSGEIFLGVKNAEQKKVAGAGYKKYFITYGILSALLILIFYWNLSQPDTRKKYSMGFLILIILTFMDCEYPYWFSWMLGYTLGCGTQLKPRIDGRNEEDEELSAESPRISV